MDLGTATLLPSTNGRRIGCTDSFHNLLRSVPSLWRLLPVVSDKHDGEARRCKGCQAVLVVAVSL